MRPSWSRKARAGSGRRRKLLCLSVVFNGNEEDGFFSVLWVKADFLGIDATPNFVCSNNNMF